MLTKKRNLGKEKNNIISDSKKLLFFDIETTGLSAKESFVYLIGVLYFEKNEKILIQWFAEIPGEEKEVLKTFFSFSLSFHTLIHYNGTRFDLPFLKKRCQLFQLDFGLNHIKSVDLYQAFRSRKTLFSLPDYKQQTLEEFFGFLRKEKESGEELIAIYVKYLGKHHYETLLQNTKALSLYPISPYTEKEESGLTLLPLSSSSALQNTLLFHNQQDLLGLLHLFYYTSYLDLFSGDFTVSSLLFEEPYYHFYLKTESPLPVPLYLDRQDDFFVFSANNSDIFVSVPYYKGELKYFYENYKDYYYLPLEDQAIHSSVAIFVEKQYREKAKKRNCYMRHTGVFLQLPTPFLDVPLFYKNYKEFPAYLEVNHEFLSNYDLQRRYLLCLFNKAVPHYIRHSTDGELR